MSKGEVSDASHGFRIGYKFLPHCDLNDKGEIIAQKKLHSNREISKFIKWALDVLMRGKHEAAISNTDDAYCLIFAVIQTARAWIATIANYLYQTQLFPILNILLPQVGHTGSVRFWLTASLNHFQPDQNENPVSKALSYLIE